MQELFPAINPYTAEQAKRAMLQFYSTGNKCACFMYRPLKHLAQGDIIENLPFRIYDHEGNEHSFLTKGLLLSNTCDAANDESILFAPLLPLNELSADKNALIKNQNFRLLYFPDSVLSDFAVDLSIINSYNKEIINNSIETGRLQKILSLNDFGYYLFLSKLTVHLMRPEDIGVQNARESSSIN